MTPGKMSGNEDDKGDINKVYPLDLVSKLNVKSVGELPKGTPLLMTGQPLRKVLTQAVSVSGNTGVSSSTSGNSTGAGQPINIVPQTMIKQGQNIGLTVARPAQITLATSVVQSGATYHVPRGAATVANLATPRSAVATAIRAPAGVGVVATPQSIGGGGFVSTVRQVTPVARTPSPAAGTWLAGNMNMQLQNQQIVKGVVGATSGSASSTAALQQRISTVVGRTQIITRTTPSTTNAGVGTGAGPGPGPGVGTSATSTPLTSVAGQLRHSTIIGGQPQPPIHAFKTTLAQVLHARPQTLVYSAGSAQAQAAQAQHHHFMARSQVRQISGTAITTVAVAAAVTTTTTIAATATTTPSSSSSSNSSNRPLNQMIGARVAVPIPVQGPITSTRLTVTPGSTTIYTTGAARLAHNIATGARINIQQQQQQTTNVNRSNIATAGTLLTTPARITVQATPQQQQQQPQQQPQQNAVVIGTQAGGRLAASVVSLHPVVVGNTSHATRHIITQHHQQQQQQQQSKIVGQSNPGQTIQLTQIPTVGKLPVVPVASSTRTINAAIVSQRHVPPQTQAQTISIPITKVFPAQGNTTTTPIIRRTTSTSSSSPPASNPKESETEVTTYYYHDAGSAPGAFSVSSGTATTTTPFQNQVHGIMGGQSFQFSPVMVVEQKRSITTTSTAQQYHESTTANIAAATTSSSSSTTTTNSPNQLEHMNLLPSIGKVTSSPRPSILRKRDRERDDGTTLKAAKNLAPLLSNVSVVAAVAGPTSPPSRPLSRDNNGNSSGGSTTISATSSPGLGEIGGDDSLPLPPVVVVQPPAAAHVALKLAEEVNRRQQQQHHQQQQQQHQQEEDCRRHAQEMSPRKKPRKQQLIGNDEPKFNLDDMQFLSENKIKREIELTTGSSITSGTATVTAAAVTIPPRSTTSTSINNNEVSVKKPQSASLLNSYRQTWKSTHNHYLRYTDVKPKEERRPTIIDLANQTHVMQKINGWKIHHLSTQMEDLCDLETQVYDKLSNMLKQIETKDSSGFDKDFNRINELIKGNMQRSKIINDSTAEAKSQVMKIFDHKEHVADIIQRCASKRNFKKREK